MKVIDSLTGEVEQQNKCNLVVVDIKEDYLIYGYVKDPSSTILVNIVDRDKSGQITQKRACYDLVKDDIFYSNLQGIYYSKFIGFSRDRYIQERFVYGSGKFPYLGFSRRYEAIENFQCFENKQRIDKIEFFEFSKYLKYTFGLEFETSGGYIPEHLCYKNGLIPLRDGSIKGLEYSTVVLSGNEGLNLLRQEVDTLKEFTIYNKECSLHVHLGGFPLNPKHIYNLYYVAKNLEMEFMKILPAYAFRSASYKATKKDYCKILPDLMAIPNFDRLYEFLVEKHYLGSLTQPHPRDIAREAKWRIPTRYFWLNFINLLCYNVNKTAEFRFLSPTFNFKKIILWLSILNGVLLFAETTAESPRDKVNSILGNGLKGVMMHVYPQSFAEQVMVGISKLSLLSSMQASNGDNIGADSLIENKLFS